MEIHIIQDAALKIAQITGDMNSADVERLKETLEELVTGPDAGSVVDLTGLRTINSAGLAALIHLVTRSRLAGGQVVLVNPMPFVREILEITRLDRLFDICATLEEARRRLSLS